jgi:flagellin-specific chaperone FliS
METKEQEIRVKIVPQLQRFSDALFDYTTVDRLYLKKLDKIIDELTAILNEESNDY